MNTCVKCHNKTKEHIKEIMHWTWKCDDNQKRVPRTTVTVGNPRITPEDMEGNCLDCHREFRTFSKSFSENAKYRPKVDCII